jgi:hypothetical protein
MSARKYAPPQLKFMRDKIRELEELGLVYKNTGAEWASPPLILPKPGPDQFRMTVDLRVPNASTKPTAWPMPNLQDKLHDLHGSGVFATLDFCQGYWQIPLHKDSQYCQSFITPDGAYTPTRVLHGTRNATQHLQSVLVFMMYDIKSNIKVWLDDCLLHTKTEDDLLAILNGPDGRTVGLSSRKLNALRVVCDCHRRTVALSASWSLEQKKLFSCAHFVIINFCHHSESWSLEQKW